MKRELKRFIDIYCINNRFDTISILKNNKIIYSTSNNIFLNEDIKRFIKEIDFFTYHYFNCEYNLEIYSNELRNCEIYNMKSDIYFKIKSTYKNSFIFPLSQNNCFIKIDTDTNDYTKYIFAKYLFLQLNKYIKYL